MDVLFKTITSKRYELLTDEENLSRMQNKIDMYIKTYHLPKDNTFCKIRIQKQRLSAKVYVHYPVTLHVKNPELFKGFEENSSLQDLLK